MTLSPRYAATARCRRPDQRALQQGAISWRCAFARRISLYATTAATLVAQYTALVTLVSPTQVPRLIEHDSDDDHVIAAAVAARAHLIVTGDRKHLLPIGAHAGIAIVTAAEALRRIAAQPA
jgi:predicted nucleic acid-binding protein